MWTAPLEELVLACLCGDCASQSATLLERYGGLGKSALTLVSKRGQTVAPGAVRRATAAATAAAVYALVALALFLVVTAISARPH